MCNDQKEKALQESFSNLKYDNTSPAEWSIHENQHYFKENFWTIKLNIRVINKKVFEPLEFHLKLLHQPTFDRGSARMNSSSLLQHYAKHLRKDLNISHCTRNIG